MNEVILLREELDKEYKKLSTRYSLYSKYSKPSSWLLLFSVIYFFSYIPLRDLYLDVLNIKVGDPRILLPMFLPAALLLVIAIFISRKAYPYALTTEQYLFLNVYSIITDLDRYYKEKLEYWRVQAGKKIAKVVKSVGSWSSGDLKLVRKTLGSHLESLNRNFKSKLLPAITEGDEENLLKAHSILISFAQYLLEPTIDLLEHLNKEMSTITTLPTAKLSLVVRFSNLLKIYPVLKHILAGLGCFVGGVFVFLLGVYGFHISVESSYSIGTTFTGTLFIAYITYVSIRKK